MLLPQNIVFFSSLLVVMVSFSGDESFHLFHTLNVNVVILEKCPKVKHGPGGELVDHSIFNGNTLC